jgi:hypothetical protein
MLACFIQQKKCCEDKSCNTNTGENPTPKKAERPSPKQDRRSEDKTSNEGTKKRKDPSASALTVTDPNKRSRKKTSPVLGTLRPGNSELSYWDNIFANVEPEVSGFQV